MPQKFRTDTTSSKRQAKYQYSPYEPASGSASVKSHYSGPSGPASVSNGGQNLRKGGVPGALPPNASSNSATRSASSSGAGNRALTLLVVLGGMLYLLLQLIALRQSEFRYSVAESRFIASHRHGHAGGGGGAHSRRKIHDHNLHVEDGTGRVEVIVDGAVSNMDLGNTYGNAAGGHEGRGELRVRLPNGRGEMLRPAPHLALKVGEDAWDEDRRRDHDNDNHNNENGNGDGDGWEPEPPPDEAILDGEGDNGAEGGGAPLDADATIARAKQSQRDADRANANANAKRKRKGGGGDAAGGDGRLRKARAEAMGHFKAHEVDADVNRPASLTDLVHKMMPDNLEYASDVSTRPDPENLDVPIFWDMPASGSDLMATIARECLHLGTVTNLQRAKEGWGLKPEDGVVLTPDIWNAIDYLDGINHGRLFGLFLHPVHRAVRMLAKQKEEDPIGIGRLGTLEEYARSKYHEPNWMVRHLAGVPSSDKPTANDLAVAKEVMRTKFIVGMVPFKDGSLKRFEEYFGWIYPAKGGVECRQRAIADATAAEKSNVKEGSPGWVALSKANDLDIKLYEYANHLFFAQKDMFD